MTTCITIITTYPLRSSTLVHYYSWSSHNNYHKNEKVHVFFSSAQS